MCMYVCGHLPSTLEPFLQSYVFDRLSFMNAHVLSLFTTVCHTYIALLYLKTSHHMEGIYTPTSLIQNHQLSDIKTKTIRPVKIAPQIFASKQFKL